MSTAHTATQPYQIRLALALEKLRFTMEWLCCSQDEAIAEVAREFSVQPDDVEAAALAKATGGAQ